MSARILALFVAVLTLIGAGPAAAQTPKVAPLTILISIDGFRADYLKRGKTPALTLLATDGVRSEGMRPSFPSLTFPNHYTLATGLRPDRNGMVNNRMEDAARPGVVFDIHDSAKVLDPFWWDQAEPIWVTAEKAGVRTAAMFFAGTEVPIHGVRPQDWRPFNNTVPPEVRVARVLEWAGRPPAERPRFITLYLNAVDQAGHRGGPDSDLVDKALRETDAAIGLLLRGLVARGQLETTNLIIVADHGMAATSQSRTIRLGDLMPSEAFRAVSSGAEAGVQVEPGHEEEVAKALLAPHDHMSCWRKAEIPERFHYGKNPRVPPFVCLAEIGWMIVPGGGPGWVGGSTLPAGEHGYDPYDPQMAALFVARGPSFRHGAVLPSFDNVDVYPLVAAVIGVKPLPNDGNLEDVRAALAP